MNDWDLLVLFTTPLTSLTAWAKDLIGAFSGWSHLSTRGTETVELSTLGSNQSLHGSKIDSVVGQARRINAKTRRIT